MEKKEAAEWYKKKLARMKKAASALKKVKNEKTAKKAAAAIMKDYGKLVGTDYCFSFQKSHTLSMTCFMFSTNNKLQIEFFK